MLADGPSIIGQWYAALGERLRQRYPGRLWLLEHRILDGSLAPDLWRTAEADVDRFAPDLLGFHD